MVSSCHHSWAMHVPCHAPPFHLSVSSPKHLCMHPWVSSAPLAIPTVLSPLWQAAFHCHDNPMEKQLDFDRVTRVRLRLFHFLRNTMRPTCPPTRPNLMNPSLHVFPPTNRRPDLVDQIFRPFRAIYPGQYLRTIAQG